MHERLKQGVSRGRGSMLRASVFAGLTFLFLTDCTTGLHSVASIYAQSGKIGPEGGTLTVAESDDGTLRGTNVTIPPGALSDQVEFHIYQEYRYSVGRAEGPRVVIEPEDTRFTSPVTVTIPSQSSFFSAHGVHVLAVYPDGVRETIAAESKGDVVVFTAQRLGSFAALSPSVIQEIRIAPDGPSIALGLRTPFTATATFSDETTADVTSDVVWTSSNDVVGTVGVDGQFTPLRVGTTTLTATLGDHSGSATVTVLPAAATDLNLEPGMLTMAEGTTRTLTAHSRYTDDTVRDVSTMVSWHSDLPAVATVDSAGVVTAGQPGTATIFVSTDTLVGTAEVTVTAKSISSITVSAESTTIPNGDTASLTATGTYDNGDLADLTTTCAWGSSNAAVATVTGGTVTCHSLGTTTITAAAEAVSGLLGITCGPAILAHNGLALTPDRRHLAIGEQLEMTLRGTYTDGTTADLTAEPRVSWSTNFPVIATVPPSGSGVVTTHAMGTVIVTATVDGQTAAATIYVGPPQPVSLEIRGADGTEGTPAGLQVQYTAILTYTDGSTIDVTSSAIWTSAQSSIATVSEGRVTALLEGQVEISASVSGLSATTLLNVLPPALVALSVAPVNRIPLGMQQQMTATASYSDGTQRDATLMVTWSSSDPYFVSMSTRGQASALHATSGVVTITAALGGFAASTQLTIGPPVLISITVTSTGGAMPAIAGGETLQLQANGFYSDHSELSLAGRVTWTSSSSAVATISSSGLVMGRAPGVTTITATQGSISRSLSVTVTSLGLTALVLGPNSSQVHLGLTRQITAIGIFSDSSTADVSGSVIWTSSNTEIATVGPTGLVSSIAQGTTQITAHWGSIVSSPVTVTVIEPDLTKLRITPDQPHIMLGSTLQLNAVGEYSDGTTRDLSSVVDWVSEDNNTFRVDPGGLVHAVGQGIATIRASVPDGTDWTTNVITVEIPRLMAINLSPRFASLTKDGDLQLTATGRYSDGSFEDLTLQVLWQSSDDSVLTITNGAPLVEGTTCSFESGCVRGIAAGTATVTATFGPVSASEQVSVSP